MNKTLTFLATFGLSTSVLAGVCSGPNPGPAPSECFSDPSDAQVIPYFNTRNGWSARFSITNPTNKKIAVTVNVRDVDGNVRGYNHIVLNPHDMVASSIGPGNKEGNSWWFISEQDHSCKFYQNDFVPIDEGYLTVESKGFTTLGPAGFCGNDYTFIDTDKLYYEYSIWTPTNLLNDYRVLPSLSEPVQTAWTRNNGRSTAWIVNLDTAPRLGSCESYEYLIANRDGYSFQTYDTIEPGPVGYKNFELCHKVNVINFGKPIFDSSVSVQAEEQMPFLNTPFIFEEIDAGWVQLMTPARSVSIRSEY